MSQLDSYTPTSGSTDFEIDHYDLELDYEIRPNRLSGHAVLHGRMLSDASRIELDLRGLKVSQVLVNNAKARFRQSRAKLVLHTRLAAEETFTLDVRYAGKPRAHRGTWGDVGWEELSDGVLVAGQPNGAATWFPCNDHPRHKATYRCTVLLDSDYTAISNGELRQVTPQGSRTSWTWESNHPVATYLATVQIGAYRRGGISPAGGHSRARVPLRLACGDHLWKQAQATLTKQHAMMRVFEQRFGDYPFDSYLVVVTDEALEIPLESQPLSILGSNHLIPGWANERLIAHELAHQWFGNSLTPHRWSDTWLNEGFAAYSEWLWSEESGQRGIADHAREAHAQLTSQPQNLVLTDPGGSDMFDERVYLRGALTLHALRSHTGDEVFFTMLRSWTRENRYATVSTTGFLSHAERISGQPVWSLLHGWLFEPELPGLP